MDEIQDENLNSPNEAADNDTINEEAAADATTEDELARLKEQNRKLFERAKKAEGFVLRDGHWVKPERKPDVEVAVNNPAQQDIAEELKLIARGLSDEEIDQAKVIAKGRGISLPEALKDPLFTAFKASKAEQEQKDGAHLGASRGSSFQQEEPLVKPGMNRDEHLKIWKEKLGR